MTTKYLAIPLLVYVPEGHAFSTLRGEEYTESSLLDHLQLIGLEALIAEDFQSTTVETDHSTHEHAARISAVCPAINLEPRLPKLNPADFAPDFNPYLAWYDLNDPISREQQHPDPIAYCEAQPNPWAASHALALANLQMDEKGWVAEFLKRCPDFGIGDNPPEIQTT
jgi:hypothetical protein